MIVMLYKNEYDADLIGVYRSLGDAMMACEDLQISDVDPYGLDPSNLYLYEVTLNETYEPGDAPEVNHAGRPDWDDSTELDVDESDLY